MAKAKKQHNAASKAPKTAGATPAAAGETAPLIDTNLAAAAAAKLLAHKDELAGASEKAGAAESADFKKLKDSLKNPIGQSTHSFLQNTTQAKKFNSSVPGRGQVGHNQTFGADVNRTGVPRRTGG